MQQNNNEINNIAEDEISLKELILKIKDWYRFLLTKWVVIVASGIIGGAIGLGYSFLSFLASLTTSTITGAAGCSVGCSTGAWCCFLSNRKAATAEIITIEKIRNAIKFIFCFIYINI